MTMLIIPYQELPGNYNIDADTVQDHIIIPYQELPGNYNLLLLTSLTSFIIPYQELPGNYNEAGGRDAAGRIIPYQELPGNYNAGRIACLSFLIIPYQELPGNYNPVRRMHKGGRNYTIPRTSRELQPQHLDDDPQHDYTIPRTTRELQRLRPCPQTSSLLYHTKNYQGTTTSGPSGVRRSSIIPYQELPGNYNKMSSTIMTMLHYTIPRNTRELQQLVPQVRTRGNYTIPRTTRELQHTMDTVKEMERLYHTKNYQGTTT